MNVIKKQYYHYTAELLKVDCQNKQLEMEVCNKANCELGIFDFAIPEMRVKSLQL